MTTMTETTTQVFRVWIKADRTKVWDAITDPEWNGRYGYQAVGEYDLEPGGGYRVLATAEMKEHGASDVIIEGEVLESDPPKRLVQTWHALFGPETTAEPPTRLTWVLEEPQPGLTELTLTHELEGAPNTAFIVSGEAKDAGGGWAWILSDLKSLLETGASMNA